MKKYFFNNKNTPPELQVANITYFQRRCAKIDFYFKKEILLKYFLAKMRIYGFSWNLVFQRP